MSELLQLVSASGALLIAKSALFGIRILVLMLIAIYSPSSELAAASFALSVTEIARWIADFGTDTWTVRAIAMTTSSKQHDQVIAASLFIKLIGSLLVAPGIYLICTTKLHQSGSGLGLVGVALLFSSQIVGLTIAYCQATSQVRKLGRMFVPCIVTAVAAWLSLRVTHDFLAALGIMAAGEIFVAVVLLALVYRTVKPVAFRLVVPQAAAMARRCIPVAALGIIVGIYSRIDSLVLAGLSFEALAAYTIVQRLFQPFQIAATSFGAIVYTRAAHASLREHSYTRTFVVREMPAIVAASIVLAALLYLSGTVLLTTVFPQYLSAQGPLGLLCVLLPVLAYNSAICGLLVGYGRFWTVLVISAADLLLCYLVMTNLVPLRQAIGTVESLLVGALFNGMAFSLATALVARSRTRQIQ